MFHCIKLTGAFTINYRRAPNLPAGKSLGTCLLRMSPMLIIDLDASLDNPDLIDKTVIRLMNIIFKYARRNTTF